MGFFSPSGSSHRRSSKGHGSGQRSSGHRHGKSSSSSSGHGGSGSGSGSHSHSSSSSSRTSDRARRRSHPAPSVSVSPPPSLATADDDGSVAGTTPAATTTTEATEYGEEEAVSERDKGAGEESEESEDSEEEEEEGEEEEEEDPGYALDYAAAGDDDGYDDADPGQAARAALTQQVRAHVFENGLRYHAFRAPASAARPGGGKLYALPNDEVEQNRDDMKHAVTVQLMHGELFYAPVQPRLAAGGVVYDLGTGTGIWAIEVGDKYPNAVVHGIDLSPIQPNYVPRNVYFVVDDFEDDWDAPPAALDFVHMRHSLWAVDDRPALLRRIFHHLKPGGFVEFQEFVPELCFEGEEGGGSGGGGGSSSHKSSSSSSGKHRHHHHHHRHRSQPSPPEPNAYRDFLQYIGMGMQQSAVLAGGDLFGVRLDDNGNVDDNNVDPDAAAAAASPAVRLDRTLAADLAAAGFRGTRTATHKAPLGDWSASSSSSSSGGSSKHRHQQSPHHRRNGTLLQRAVLDGLRGWAARPLGTAAGGLGWTPTQIEIYLVYVRKALADPAARAYLPLHVTYAQKPE